MRYSAFIGRHPQISIAELSAKLPDFSLSKVLDEQVALFDTAEELDQGFLDEMGGTILLARRVTEEQLSLDDIPQILSNEIKAKRGKLTFSLRTINIPRPMIGTLYRRCKKRLKDEGRGCRYVGSEKKPAATAVLYEADLIEGKNGCELVLIAINEEEDRTLWIGRTIAAQDIDRYSKRDMEKPVRDTTVGLLPPKLAQIMINFGEFLVREWGVGSRESGKKLKDSLPMTIYDPFCGTGVIPMEALLRGFNVLASDVSLKAVNGCKKNLEWLRKEEKIFKKDVLSEVFRHDALKPFDFKNPPDVIVTETSLGPPITSRPSQKEVSKLKTQNEKLQCCFLENAAKSLPGIPIVCAWPAWRQKGGWVRLEKVWSTIDSLKLRAALPPGIVPENNNLSLFYSRKDQFVGREIVLLLPAKQR